jgi:hypothetical protein
MIDWVEMKEVCFPLQNSLFLFLDKYEYNFHSIPSPLFHPRTDTTSYIIRARFLSSQSVSRSVHSTGTHFSSTSQRKLRIPPYEEIRRISSRAYSLGLIHKILDENLNVGLVYDGSILLYCPEWSVDCWNLHFHDILHAI